MYELIAHQKLESTASAITFSNIPQTYTDLYVTVSVRSTNADDGLFFKFNNTTSNTSWRNLLGYGTGTLSQGGGGWLAGGGVRSGTASTFTNVQVYVPSYASGVAKTASVDSTSEENGSTAYQFLVNNLWNDTAAINRIDFYLQGGQLAVGSSATLYGVNRVSATSPMATGGSITYADGYWYHTFLSSGTFTPLVNLNTEFLVVAGGGGGGYQHGGGGGAGGYYSNKFTATASTGYTVTVGAGGVSNTNNSAPGGTGSNSTFNSITMLGGGGGGDRFSSPGTNGGSGGGGGYFTAAGAGTPPYGNSGGAGDAHGGGGGGAGAAGQASTSTLAGNGGIGLQWVNGKYYAGGGGGGHQGSSDPASLGGLGGGGNGSGAVSGIAGEIGTGGGGGGSRYPGYSYGHGGSGVVIIRYKA